MAAGGGLALEVAAGQGGGAWRAGPSAVTTGGAAAREERAEAGGGAFGKLMALETLELAKPVQA